MAREVPLYEIPKEIERAKVLDASILAKYNDSVKSAYNSDKARQTLTKFGKSEGELTGSNPFMLIHLQNAGLVDGRIATRQDLENALRFGLNLSGNYVDFGMALKTAGDSYGPNDLLAKNLAGQLEQRAIKLGKGKFIPISALALRENENSAYGLVMHLKDSAGIDDLDSQKWNYSREQGLARACLCWLCCWDCCGSGLAVSCGDGRVVVVSGEATQKNLDQYANKRKLIQENYVNELKALRNSIDLDIKNR